MARKLALVPEEGASLPIYLLSYLQSFLLVKAVSPIPKHELDDQPIDAESLDTYQVLQRARYVAASSSCASHTFSRQSRLALFFRPGR